MSTIPQNLLFFVAQPNGVPFLMFGQGFSNNAINYTTSTMTKKEAIWKGGKIFLKALNVSVQVENWKVRLMDR